jgi:1-acyl-sn-glycerol-3-phosphate acyltransferase
MSNQFKLLTERRFAPFFITQFLGAGNDNVFKFSFTLMVTYGYGLNPADLLKTGLDAHLIAQLIAALFTLPFLLFSATSGQLSDKYEKSRLMRGVKNLEILIMLIAYFGFTTANVFILLGCTFAMGLHSTLFGPVKYAYLPQHLTAEELTGGNGMVEMGTFVSILLGTIMGGFLIAWPIVGVHYTAIACILMAIFGRIAAQFLPNSPATAPDLTINWNPFTETFKNLKLAHSYPVVFRCLIGISWLWFFGAVILTLFPALAKETLKGDANVATVLLMVFSIGIGLGSLACELLSRRRIEIGLVPIGAFGMTFFGILLYLFTVNFSSELNHTVIDNQATQVIQPILLNLTRFLAQDNSIYILTMLFFLSFSAGLFSVPMYALIQARSPDTHRARIIATNNIINALFMIVAALMIIFLQTVFQFSVPEILLTTALLNIVVVSYVFLLTPEFLLRFISYGLAHVIYRFKVNNETHIPTEGACLLVCNHVSFIDVLLLMAASPRPIYFVMDYQIYKIPVANILFKAGKAIPITSRYENPHMLEMAFQQVVAHLADGDIVGIFPEGKLTADGKLNEFKHGMRAVLDIAATQNIYPPVVPMALQGLWGSFFSRIEAGTAMKKPFRRGMFSRVTLNIGSSIPAKEATTEHVFNAVKQLKEGKL